jgi:hypothetical protein
MRRYEILGASLLAISILLRIFYLPRSPGNFYGPAHYYNLYLPNFGLGLEVSILPSAFRTLSSFYSLSKMLLEIFGEDVLVLHQSLWILSPVLTFSAFILFFSLISLFRENRVLLSGTLSLLLSWSPVVLVLGMTTLYCIIKFTARVDFSLAISWILAFITLSLYWHSADMLFCIPIIISLIFLVYYNLANTHINLPKAKSSTILLISLLFISSVTVAIWTIVRGGLAFSTLHRIDKLFDPQVIWKGSFAKGSFVLPEFQYIIDFFVPVYVIDVMRYVTYFLTIIIILIYIYNTKNCVLEKVLAKGLLFGSIIFMFLYFMATLTIGSAPIVVFLIPFALGLCILKAKSNKDPLKVRLIYGAAFFIIGSLILTALYNICLYTNNTEFRCDFETYRSSSMWIATNLPSNTKLLSDANTLGYIAIHYAKNKQYNINPLFFYSIGNFTYVSLYNGEFNSSAKILYNFNIYRENLIFESLQAWNKFKPLPPQIVQKNKLNVLYNDNFVWVLSK